jgi:hypothetical protein
MIAMRSPANPSAAVIFAMVMGCAGVVGRPVRAADPVDTLPVRSGHPLVTGHLPAGAVGHTQMLAHPSIPGYFQPVAFSGPSGTRFALPQNGHFSGSDPSLMAGLLVGAVYRFRITEIPDAFGAELYPTVELIDRTYPPPGLATLHPIPINLDQDDLDAALEGRMVTRVIYLEDQQTAMPLPETPTTSRAIDIAQYQDPLEVADRLGRPVAIVRIGTLTPPASPELMCQFLFGYPMWAPIHQPDSAGQP